jgi:membrane protein YqaA with SNARE-associated domain
VKLLLLTFGFGALSAVIPIFNMEAYIVLAYARASHHSPGNALLLAILGSFGQNVGKLVWYYASRGALKIEWLERRLQDPKRRASYERWREQVEGKPLFSGLLTFVSAAIGFPPFFAMAAVAGTLRMNVVVFFVAGFVGRVLFFWAILLGFGLVIH